jgi:hypothetical protein
MAELVLAYMAELVLSSLMAYRNLPLKKFSLPLELCLNHVLENALLLELQDHHHLEQNLPTYRALLRPILLLMFYVGDGGALHPIQMFEALRMFRSSSSPQCHPNSHQRMHHPESEYSDSSREE